MFPHPKHTETETAKTGLRMQDLPPLQFDRKRFQLAKTCPCGKSNRDGKFVPYKGFEDKGYCHSCGETFLPEIENDTVSSFHALREKKRETSRQIEFIAPDILKSTLRAYEQNTFVKYLNTIFDKETVQRLIDAYGLGTAKDGSCIFWQVDNLGLIRTGKVIRYQQDGHRDKSQPPYFIHTKLKVEPIEQCLFGLHLLMVDHRIIGLVESEKTAVIMSGCLPDYTWVATGGKTNLSKVDILKGKKVVAFPDTDAFQVWSERLTPYGFKISKTLQQHVGDTDHGYDLADFVTIGEKYLETLKDGRVIEMHQMGYPMEWEIKKPYVCNS